MTTHFPRVIFLNGPPHSGKDYAGRLLQRRYVDKLRARTLSIAEPLKEAVHRLCGIDKSTSWIESKHPNYKDEPTDIFFGNKARELYIEMSENFGKPWFGPEFLGHVAVRKIMSPESACSLWIITDPGFLYETTVIAEAVRATNCLQVRLERHGTSFDGDSRSYWSHPRIRSIDVFNPAPWPTPTVRDELLMYHELFNQTLCARIDKWLGLEMPDV